MENVIPITQPRTFTLIEAQGMLPVIRKITKDAVAQFVVLEQKLKSIPIEEEEASEEIENQISNLLEKWSEKIIKLGCHPKGIWLVDFDSGSGYYCWRYDESEVTYFHGYQEGYGQRQPIL